jgi:ATP-dependent Lon protease
MIETLKVGDKVKIKKRSWEKKYVGTIKKIYKKGKMHLFDIILDNKKFETLKRVKSSIIFEKIVKKSSKSEMSKELQQLVKLKMKNKGKYEKKMKEYEEKLENERIEIEEKKEKKIKQINVDRFKKLLREKNNTNDLSYFKNMLISEQKNILRNLFEINKVNVVEKPYKLSLIEAPIPAGIKSVAMKKVNMLSMMDPCSGDYYKNKLWVDTFMSIPFGKYSSLPVDFKNGEGLEECRTFMENSKKVLDDCVYGLNDAKMQIMQMIGGWISNPNAVGTAIAIQGPMGTGKTTLVKEGISKILNRPFAFIPLGGATDSSYLEGHSYTYEGSIWGKIVDVLIHSKCMNPVFYFDELDKVSNTPKGEEIIGILTHLTDTTQNSQFHDKYFSNLDFDLSKALFIFSYNHEEKVNSILKDRMYRIKTKGYDKKDKKIIASQHLIPKIEKNINFKKGEIIFPDETIEYISEKFTDDEKGVRNLKRCLEIIYGKLNLFRLMNTDSNLFEGQEVIQIEYPFTVTNDVVDKLIKKQDKANIPFGMYM